MLAAKVHTFYMQIMFWEAYNSFFFSSGGETISNEIDIGRAVETPCVHAR